MMWNQAAYITEIYSDSDSDEIILDESVEDPWAQTEQLPLVAVTPTPSGGYENEFLDKIPDKYKCMICHKVQREATITSCCCKHYCKSCIEEWFRQQGKSCPHCRSTSFTHFVNRQQVQDINELRVFCSNRGDGCEWEGQLDGLQSHVDSICDYTPVNCPNDCHETVLRKQLENHKERDCFLRSYRCKYCGLEDTYHAITGECGKYDHCDVHEGHYKSCGEFPLECPNKCKRKMIKREDMDSHLEECLLQPVDCPFQEVGCTTHVVRKDLQEHVDSSDHYHLLLLKTAYEEIKTENARLTDRVNALETQLAQSTSIVPQQQMYQYAGRHFTDSFALQPQPRQYTQQAPPQPGQYTQQAPPQRRQYTQQAQAQPRQYTQQAPSQRRQYTQQAPSQRRQYTLQPQPLQYTQQAPPQPLQYTQQAPPQPRQYIQQAPSCCFDEF